MKNLVNIFALAFTFVLFANNETVAQSRLGYIDSGELLQAMPGTAKVDSQLVEYGEGLRKNLLQMQADFEVKLDDYRAKQSTLSDTEKRQRERELQDINLKMQQFQAKAEKDFDAKKQELMAPILKKAQDAINAVALEYNFTYVIDAATRVLLHAPEKDNMLPLVKKKLGIE